MTRGELVLCPKSETMIPSVARDPIEHDDLRNALIKANQYCEVIGEPRRTENVEHL